MVVAAGVLVPPLCLDRRMGDTPHMPGLSMPNPSAVQGLCLSLLALSALPALSAQTKEESSRRLFSLLTGKRLPVNTSAAQLSFDAGPNGVLYRWSDLRPDEPALSLGLGIPWPADEFLKRYQNLRHRHGDYNDFINDDPGLYYLLSLAVSLHERSRALNHPPIETALSLVQALPYAAREDYQQYATETILRGEGDCSDKSVLFAAFTAAWQIPTAFLLFPETKKHEAHLAVGVSAGGRYPTNYSFEGRPYSYCETTSIYWSIGEVPEDFEDERPIFLPAKLIIGMDNEKYLAWYRAQRQERSALVAYYFMTGLTPEATADLFKALQVEVFRAYFSIVPAIGKAAIETVAEPGRELGEAIAGAFAKGFAATIAFNAVVGVDTELTLLASLLSEASDDELRNLLDGRSISDVLPEEKIARLRERAERCLRASVETWFECWYGLLEGAGGGTLSRTDANALDIRKKLESLPSSVASDNEWITRVWTRARLRELAACMEAPAFSGEAKSAFTRSTPLAATGATPPLVARLIKLLDEKQ